MTQQLAYPLWTRQDGDFSSQLRQSVTFPPHWRSRAEPWRSRWLATTGCGSRRVLAPRAVAFIFSVATAVIWAGAPFWDYWFVRGITQTAPSVKQVAAAFLPAASEAAEFVPSYQDYFGLADFRVSYVPSDVAFTPYQVTMGRTALGDSAVFDNEGTYYWDVSVAVPIRKMSQTKIDKVSSTIAVNNVDRRNVFAVLDLYPFKKDVKASGFDWRPYGLTGVAMGSQPLHKILVGAGGGPKFAQFYAGALFVKQPDLQTLGAGSMATPAQQAADTKMKFKPQFAFGINLPVREVARYRLICRLRTIRN